MTRQGIVSFAPTSLSQFGSEAAPLPEDELQFDPYSRPTGNRTGQWPGAEPALKEAVDAQIHGVQQHVEDVVEGLRKEWNAKWEGSQIRFSEFEEVINGLQGWNIKKALLQCFLLIVAGAIVALVTIYLGAAFKSGS